MECICIVLIQGTSQLWLPLRTACQSDARKCSSASLMVTASLSLFPGLSTEEQLQRCFDRTGLDKEEEKEEDDEDEEQQVSVCNHPSP